MKTSFGVITCMIGVCFASAQNAAVDFSKINENLRNNDLEVYTEYRVYENHLTNKTMEISRGVLKQKRSCLVQQIESLHTLMNEKITVHLDTVDRLLVVSDAVVANQSDKKSAALDVELYIDKYKRIEYAVVGGNHVKYTMEFKDDVVSDFSICELYFDKSTNLPERVVFYYDGPMNLRDEETTEIESAPRLEIVFLKIDLNPSFDQAEFDERKYLSHIGSKIVAATPYKSYRIVDNRYLSRVN